MLGAEKTSVNGPVPPIAAITCGVGGSQCGLAEHVEGITVVGAFALAAARERLADGPAEHELVAHDLHCLAHGQADHRFSGATDQPLEGAVGIALGVVGEIDQPACEHQAPGGGVDQYRFGLAQMTFPVGVAELVADQRVGCVLVRDAQQRFCNAHQQNALVTAEVVLAHEGFDHALVARARAYTPDQVCCGFLRECVVSGRQFGDGQQLADMLCFGQ